jgi:hypothetical protein
MPLLRSLVGLPVEFYKYGAPLVLLRYAWFAYFAVKFEWRGWQPTARTECRALLFPVSIRVIREIRVKVLRFANLY